MHYRFFTPAPLRVAEASSLFAPFRGGGEEFSVSFRRFYRRESGMVPLIKILDNAKGIAQDDRHLPKKIMKFPIWPGSTIVRRRDNTVKRRVLRAQKANLHPLEPSECKNGARTAGDWNSMNFHSSLVGGGHPGQCLWHVQNFT